MEQHRHEIGQKQIIQELESYYKFVYYMLFEGYQCEKMNRDVLFEFHLKFWNTASIGIPVRSLL